MAYQQHIQSAAEIVARCAIVTISDTRNAATDGSGKRIAELLEEAGHQKVCYKIIPDDAAKLGPLLDELVADPKVDVVLSNGGTGISRRDVTIPVIEQRLDSSLPGFGEIFRMLSYEQIGSGAILSRAIAGVTRGKVLFAMPGSTKAVELAMTKLILPEIRHLLFELRK
jgi:molybdenum cofactor biosynthesis protein B